MNAEQMNCCDLLREIEKRLTASIRQPYLGLAFMRLRTTKLRSYLQGHPPEQAQACCDALRKIEERMSAVVAKPHFKLAMIRLMPEWISNRAVTQATLPLVDELTRLSKFARQQIALIQPIQGQAAVAVEAAVDAAVKDKDADKDLANY